MKQMGRIGKTFPKPTKGEFARVTDGRDVTEGWLADGLRYPRDKIIEQKGGYDYEVYEDILSDDRVQTCYQQRIAKLIARKCEVLEGGSRRIDKKAANFIRHTLDLIPPEENSEFDGLPSVNWIDITKTQLKGGLHFGFTFAEALFTVERGLICLDDIKVRRQRRFRFWKDGSPRLLTIQNPLGEPLPERKFWYFCVPSFHHDDPYGRGLGHYLYWAVWFKKNGHKFWAIFLEKFASPTVVGKYPRGASDEEKGTLLQVTQLVRSRTGVTVPEGMALELLEASRSGAISYQDFVGYWDEAITRIILSQTMTTQDGSSRSQAEVHEDVIDAIVKSDAILIARSFNNQIVKWLIDWNFPGAKYPQVRWILEDEDDLNLRADRDKKLYDMGFRLTLDAVIKVYGEGYVDAQEESENNLLIEEERLIE